MVVDLIRPPSTAEEGQSPAELHISLKLPGTCDAAYESALQQNGTITTIYQLYSDDPATTSRVSQQPDPADVLAWTGAGLRRHM